MSMEDLLARVRVLEDIEAIRKLKATYCYLCDAGLEQPSVRAELISHFSADATVDFGLGPASTFAGKDGLEQFFGSVERKAPRPQLVVEVPDYMRVETLEKALGVPHSTLQSY